MVWQNLKILWHGEDNYVGDTKMNKKASKMGEEMGRQYHKKDRNRV